MAKTKILLNINCFFAKYSCFKKICVCTVIKLLLRPKRLQATIVNVDVPSMLELYPSPTIKWIGLDSTHFYPFCDPFFLVPKIAHFQGILGFSEGQSMFAPRGPQGPILGLVRLGPKFTACRQQLGIIMKV